jgi:hypothetical protein
MFVAFLWMGSGEGIGEGHTVETSDEPNAEFALKPGSGPE